MDSVVQFDPADPPSFQRPVKRGWRQLVHYQLEVALFLMMIVSFAVVWWQDALLTRTIVIKPGSSLNRVRYYGDGGNGGTSIIRVDRNRDLHWRCELRAGYSFPYCGYDLLLNLPGANKGLDLHHLENFTIDLDYRGPSDTFRVYLKNFDPRYSRTDQPDTLKFNKIEVAARQGRNLIQLQLPDFAVAEWWITEHKIKPALSHVQLDNVTELQFQTGTQAPVGSYVFRVHSITLRSRVISQAAWYGMMLAGWAVLICLYLLYRMVKLREDLEQRQLGQAAALRLAQYAEESARRDYLTRLLNRSGIIELYHALAMNRRADASSFAVILLDIDHFKEVNDRFGHSVGDQVLAGVAEIMSTSVRSGDIVGRWGGEEFLLICSVTDCDAAMSIANKLRAAIEAHNFSVAGRVTASLGVYCCIGKMDTLEQLVSYADAALYNAKEQGRNRAVLYQPFMREAA